MARNDVSNASVPVNIPSQTSVASRQHREDGPAQRRRDDHHHLTLSTFSPVNENGSFEFDRVLKAGAVLRRSKNKHSFKASWKSSYMVLRPNLLSVYKDEEEAHLQLSIATCDISAVALVKAPRSKRPNVFGIFSPSKNYRFQAPSAADAESWVNSIRSEIPVAHPDINPILRRATDRTADDRYYDSASDMDNRLSSSQPRATHAIPISFASPPRRLSHTQDYSGNDITSMSELSDGPGQAASFQSATSFTRPRHQVSPATPSELVRPGIRRDASQSSDLVDAERVIFQGYLQCLKNIKGVRQWKKLWVVLRCQTLSFYKNEQEYSAVKIIPMDQVISAAEIDPMSRSKSFCFQIIAEDRTYRFAAADEEALNKWLGSLTSVLIKLQGAAPNPVAGPSIGE